MAGAVPEMNTSRQTAETLSHRPSTPLGSTLAATAAPMSSARGRDVELLDLQALERRRKRALLDERLGPPQWTRPATLAVYPTRLNEPHDGPHRAVRRLDVPGAALASCAIPALAVLSVPDPVED